MSFVFPKKPSDRDIWSRLLHERFSEPLHMNFLSSFVPPSAI